MKELALELEPCERLACAIQRCLKDNDFQESRCTVEIDQLILCCQKFPASRNCAFYAPNSRKPTRTYETVQERATRTIKDELAAERAARKEAEAEVERLRQQLERFKRVET